MCGEPQCSQAHPSHVPTTWPRVSVPRICFCSGGAPPAPRSLLSPSPPGHQGAALHGAAPLHPVPGEGCPAAHGALGCSLKDRRRQASLLEVLADRPLGARWRLEVLLLQLVRGGLSAPRWAGEVVSLSGLCRPLSQVGARARGGGQAGVPPGALGHCSPQLPPPGGVSPHPDLDHSPRGSCMFCGWRRGAGAARQVAGGPWGPGAQLAHLRWTSS